MRRLTLLTVLCIGSLSCFSTAHAIDLIWSTGQKNLQVATTSACTLLVVTVPGADPLPNEWSLTWIGRSSSSSPLSFAVEGPSVSQAAVCDVRRSSALPDLPPVDTLL